MLRNLAQMSDLDTHKKVDKTIKILIIYITNRD